MHAHLSSWEAGSDQKTVDCINQYKTSRNRLSSKIAAKIPRAHQLCLLLINTTQGKNAPASSSGCEMKPRRAASARVTLTGRRRRLAVSRRPRTGQPPAGHPAGRLFAKALDAHDVSRGEDQAPGGRGGCRRSPRPSRGGRSQPRRHGRCLLSGSSAGIGCTRSRGACLLVERRGGSSSRGRHDLSISTGMQLLRCRSSRR